MLIKIQPFKTVRKPIYFSGSDYVNVIRKEWYADASFGEKLQVKWIQTVPNDISEISRMRSNTDYVPPQLMNVSSWSKYNMSGKTRKSVLTNIHEQCNKFRKKKKTQKKQTNAHTSKLRDHHVPFPVLSLIIQLLTSNIRFHTSVEH